MIRVLLLPVLATILAAGPAYGWQAEERDEPYTISGATGIALYRSIGIAGPKLGNRRTVALTDFTLSWDRDYRPTADGGCRLVTAVPKLALIYRLPRPKGDLPPATRALWNDFIAGIRAHERVHGRMIVDMVEKLEAASVGLTTKNDPDCRKVRHALVAPFRRISDARVAASRAFDRDEMADGGNVHRLILKLVNGR